jgi:hypothetical protein
VDDLRKEILHNICWLSMYRKQMARKRRRKGVDRHRFRRKIIAMA